MPYTRLDISDIELKLSVVDLGRDNEVNSPFNNNILEFYQVLVLLDASGVVKQAQ